MLHGTHRQVISSGPLPPIPSMWDSFDACSSLHLTEAEPVDIPQVPRVPWRGLTKLLYGRDAVGVWFLQKGEGGYPGHSSFWISRKEPDWKAGAPWLFHRRLHGGPPTAPPPPAFFQVSVPLGQSTRTGEVGMDTERPEGESGHLAVTVEVWSLRARQSQLQHAAPGDHGNMSQAALLTFSHCEGFSPNSSGRGT